MEEQIVFTKKNYMICLAGVITIAVGYLLMVGGGSEDPTGFSEEIFSFRRISLSPLVITAGFIVMLFGIMHKEPAQKK